MTDPQHQQETTPSGAAPATGSHHRSAVVPALAVSYRTDPDGEPVDAGDAWIIATLDGANVGALRWNYLADPPTVQDVWVEPEWRLHGIATAMLGTAVQHESQLHHSTSLTGDGHAWVAALAG
jgi:GNAT superfamily N-acetyltransferase